MKTTTPNPRSHDGGDTFRHEAILYAGPERFVGSTEPFIRAAVEADEPILVVVSADKIEMLRSALGDRAAAVSFADMGEIGRNPARIIPAWSDFVAQHAESGRRFRGVGEPISQGRSPDELVECERHEALLNLAFDGAPAWWLACPYDTESLSPSVIEEAWGNHPFVASDGIGRASESFRGVAEAAQPFNSPLSEPPIEADHMAFGATDLEALRAFVAERVTALGLRSARANDLVLAANEVATNSVRHGGGRGVLRIWRAGEEVVCDVSDAGRIEEPLVGRERPQPTQTSGFGVWLANQVCDLVQVRTLAAGSVVRLRMTRRP